MISVESSPIAAGLYDQFITSPDADPIVERLFVEKFTHPSVKNLKPYTPRIRELVGPIFELFAHQKAHDNFLNRYKVLSPQETSDFYDSLYSTRGEFNGVLNEILPDGLALEPRQNNHYRITNLLEYKLAFYFMQSMEKMDSNFRQFLHLSQYEKMICSLGLNTPKGCQKAAQIISEIRPDISPKSVSLDPNYKVQYVFPQNGGFETRDLSNIPYSIFIPPNQEIRKFDSIQHEVKRRIAQPLRCDFSTDDFRNFFALMTQDIQATRLD